MKRESFASSLVRKGERAIRSARLSLEDGDADSAVNRSYYAMFNIARAALLSAGVAEGQLPRTHRGLIEAFRIHAVQAGRIDSGLASSLSRTEGLRLKADYTGTEIEEGVAQDVVEYAESFVRTVEREFGLESLLKEVSVESGQTEDRIDSRQINADAPDAASERLSPEEIRRKAVENWRREFYDKRSHERDVGQQSSNANENAQASSNSSLERDGGVDFDPED